MKIQEGVKFEALICAETAERSPFATRLLAANSTEMRSMKRDLNYCSKRFRLDFPNSLNALLLSIQFCLHPISILMHRKQGTQRICGTRKIIHLVRSSQFSRLKVCRTMFSIPFSFVINSDRWYVYTSALSRFAIHHHFSQLRARALSESHQSTIIQWNRKKIPRARSSFGKEIEFIF